MTNATPDPDATTIICYELSGARVVDMLKFEGSQEDWTLVGFYFEFKDAKVRPAKPLPEVIVVPVYREGTTTTVVRHDGGARPLRRLGRVVRRRQSPGSAEELEEDTNPYLYRKLEGYREEIEFVFFSAEDLRYLASRSETLRFSGCRIDPMEVWDSYWDTRPNEVPEDPLFTLKVEGLRPRTKRIDIKDALSAAFFMGAPCPARWYIES